MKEQKENPLMDLVEIFLKMPVGKSIKVDDGTIVMKSEAGAAVMTVIKSKDLEHVHE